MRLRTDLYKRTLHLPMSFFASRSSSDLVGRFVQDIQEIQRGMLTLVAKSFREPVRAVFILGLAFAVDWRITLVMIEHRLRELFRLAGRVIVLAEGRKIAEGDPGTVMDDAEVREAYLGSEEAPV